MDTSASDLPRTPAETGGDGASRRKGTGLLYGLVALFCAVASVLVGPPLRVAPPVYSEGDVAEAGVRADRDFLVVNEQATAAKRQEAGAAVPTVYDLTADPLNGALEVLSEVFTTPGSAAATPTPEEIAERLNARLGVAVGPRLARSLATEEQRVALYRGVTELLQPLYERRVTGNLVILVADAQRGVVLRDVERGAEEPLSDPKSYSDFDAVRRELAGRRTSAPAESVAVLSQRLAAALLRPNVAFNADETAARRRAAAEAVGPVLDKVRRGEMLVREGDRVTGDQARRLAGFAKEVGFGTARWHEYLSLFFILTAFVTICYEFGAKNVKKARLAPRDLLFLASTLLVMLLMQRLSLAVGESFEAGPAEALRFAVPMATALLVVRMVLNSETVLIFLLPYVLAAAVGAGVTSGFFVPLLAGGLLGAHMAKRVVRRMDFLRIGAWVGLTQALLALLVTLPKGGVQGADLLWPVGGALAGGILSGIAAMAVVPIAEALFGYTTEFKLMELTSLDHPLLRELMIRAPGTYHHSVVVASLVKAGAEAVGARAGLAMVASYYHDVGKMSKAPYFIENQEGGKNPHDKLTPSMSTLILINHLKEGVELAEKHRLGAAIVDIIRQHHGTALIRYFYDKAQAGARPGVDEVDEREYRYPGPKPQTREAALVMLADAVEAAARTLPDPRPARIQGMVQNLVNRIFADGQLDECDLALKDLHKIARAFTRVLSGIHHQRIDYPLAAHKEKKEDKKDDADTDPKRQPAGRAKRSEDREPAEENLKRLGM